MVWGNPSQVVLSPRIHSNACDTEWPFCILVGPSVYLLLSSAGAAVATMRLLPGTVVLGLVEGVRVSFRGPTSF